MQLTTFTTFTTFLLLLPTLSVTRPSDIYIAAREALSATATSVSNEAEASMTPIFPIMTVIMSMISYLAICLHRRLRPGIQTLSTSPVSIAKSFWSWAAPRRSWKGRASRALHLQDGEILPTTASQSDFNNMDSFIFQNDTSVRPRSRSSSLDALPLLHPANISRSPVTPPLTNSLSSPSYTSSPYTPSPLPTLYPTQNVQPFKFPLPLPFSMFPKQPQYPRMPVPQSCLRSPLPAHSVSSNIFSLSTTTIKPHRRSHSLGGVSLRRLSGCKDDRTSPQQASLIYQNNTLLDHTSPRRRGSPLRRPMTPQCLYPSQAPLIDFSSSSSSTDDDPAESTQPIHDHVSVQNGSDLGVIPDSHRRRGHIVPVPVPLVPLKEDALLCDLPLRFVAATECGSKPYETARESVELEDPFADPVSHSQTEGIKQTISQGSPAVASFYGTATHFAQENQGQEGQYLHKIVEDECDILADPEGPMGNFVSEKVHDGEQFRVILQVDNKAVDDETAKRRYISSPMEEPTSNVPSDGVITSKIDEIDILPVSDLVNFMGNLPTGSANALKIRSFSGLSPIHTSLDIDEQVIVDIKSMHRQSWDHEFGGSVQRDSVQLEALDVDLVHVHATSEASPFHQDSVAEWSWVSVGESEGRWMDVVNIDVAADERMKVENLNLIELEEVDDEAQVAGVGFVDIEFGKAKAGYLEENEIYSIAPCESTNDFSFIDQNSSLKDEKISWAEKGDVMESPRSEAIDEEYFVRMIHRHESSALVENMRILPLEKTALPILEEAFDGSLLGLGQLGAIPLLQPPFVPTITVSTGEKYENKVWNPTAVDSDSDSDASALGDYRTEEISDPELISLPLFEKRDGDEEDDPLEHQTRSQMPTPPASPPMSASLTVISRSPLRPTWSLRATDTPALGMSSQAAISIAPTLLLRMWDGEDETDNSEGDETLTLARCKELTQVEREKQVDMEVAEMSVVPQLSAMSLSGVTLGDVPVGAAAIPEDDNTLAASSSSAPLVVAQKSTALVHLVRVPERRVRSPLDIALAMQLRPGLGAGADPAWMVRFIMSMFGWFALLMSGQMEY